MVRSALVMIASLAACSSQPAVVVQLRTDFIPGVEFSQIEVGLTPSGATSEMQMTSSASVGDELLPGARIAEYEGDLPKGPAVVRVRLSSSGGTTVAERRVRFDIDGSVTVTVALTRNCAGVRCPGMGDSADATECLGMRCVRPDCSSANLGACGSPECSSDTDCIPNAACAAGSCFEGFCFYGARAGACGVGLYCHPERGCTALGMEDGGEPDAGACVDGASCTVGCQSGTTRCSDGGRSCVVDGIAPAGTLCRAAVSACDVAESCDGILGGLPGGRARRSGRRLPGRLL